MRGWMCDERRLAGGIWRVGATITGNPPPRSGRTRLYCGPWAAGCGLVFSFFKPIIPTPMALSEQARGSAK